MTPLQIKSAGVPVAEGQLVQLESELGHRLPEDYRVFLLRHNGGKPSLTLFTIPDCGEALVHVFSGIGTKVDIQKWLSEWRAEVPPGWLMIGKDPGGNLLLADELGAIHYWDAARGFPASSDARNTFQVATSFTSFLDALRSADLAMRVPAGLGVGTSRE